MIRAEQLILQIKEQGSPQRAQDMKQYMRNKFAFYGIGSPLRKELSKEYIRLSKNLTVEEILDDAAVFWIDEYRESQYIGMDMLIRNKKRLGNGEIKFVESLIITKSWWDTVDALASHLVGSIFDRYPVDRNPILKVWLSSENIWLNRTCLLFQLKYGIKTDLPLLQSYILALKHKDEFFIQKAIGWSLRQAGKYYPEDVRSFLSQTTLSNLTNREASRLLKS